MDSLKGKVAVVTGGNSGIGFASAKLFAEQGAQVVITGRRQAALDEAVRSIGPAAVAICGDVADPAHHRRSEEHTSELQSLMRISYAVFCLKKKKDKKNKHTHPYIDTSHIQTNGWKH